jgi:hypothetical protein
VSDFPLPGSGDPVVAVASPGSGVGFWAGSSTAALDDDGSFVTAYRVRTGERGHGSNVVGSFTGGASSTTLVHRGLRPRRRR